ncbi:MAG: tRNA (adenosine(37)-N6)-dimethylallyltransferase MiaA [Gammaproteobacteria bacterium]|nr:tRNA (adenosine(37)-N6)-dimethylallyltransferase MiaA [Gammaproteobacteria bacterium]
MRFRVICLMGPTASGKTDFSLRLAEEIPCEIISVDSAMVYKTMDIGTAKPTPEQRLQVKHHLIDIADPWHPYSAAKFAQDAVEAIRSIHLQGKTPILVGGTMLYFKALQQGLSPLPPADEGIRARLMEEAMAVGWAEMHQRLAKVDPLAATRINPNDPQRIQRALEVHEITNKSLSSLWETAGHSDLPCDYINIAIAPHDRTMLHENIEQRFHKMMQEGFLEEVQQLYHCDNIHIDLPSIRSVGYRQAWQYLAGKITHAQLYEMGIAATRQLAKRQLTWLRHWGTMHWIDSMDNNAYQNLLQHLFRHL